MVKNELAVGNAILWAFGPNEAGYEVAVVAAAAQSDDRLRVEEAVALLFKLAAANQGARPTDRGHGGDTGHCDREVA